MISASAALAGWYLMEGRFTTAPALDSLSRADAERVAAKVGLSVDFSEAYSETVGRGMVISTNPEPGAKILRGGNIEAALSKGPERYPMPGVVGLSRSAAVAAIEKAKLAIGKVADGYSDQVAAGTVRSASERPGARLKKGTAIDLVVSSGPKPIVITNYQGTPYDAAAAALASAGFRVVERSAYSNKVTVPNVQRMALPAARKVIREAGFKTQVQRVGVNRPGVDFVLYTNPGARTPASKGSTITLYVV